MSQNLEKYRQQVKKYLGLENVSVLAGAGASFHLGAPVIRTIPKELKTICQKDIDKYFPKDADPSFEDLFNCLQADRFLLDKNGQSYKAIDDSISEMQKWLFENCDVSKTALHSIYKDDPKLIRNRYHYHESLIKKLLQRPNNLKRVSLFTTNYDMAFDYALDNLGVHYINGFMGVHNRCFRPEVYDYDLYYPGQSVTGKVHRAEKVLKYYKIHGSLSWVSTKPTDSNTYGIKEKALEKELKLETGSELMIYPCVSKKTFSLDLPYSELFRQLSHAINQPQSVLFCVGYSFYDEHINDIIKQALSIPSFTLIIANYSPKGDKDSPIEQLKLLGDKRIIVLDQEDTEMATFTGFVDNVMPDLYELEEAEIISNTLAALYPAKEVTEPQLPKSE
ncbi:MAG: SIR2 family protein [Verrucomicrobiota bacterium]|nr:SIR2 family protein [Verrucomicrobiota bacterium]